MSEYYYEPDTYLEDEAANRDNILKNVSDLSTFQIQNLMPSPQDFIHNYVDITLGMSSIPVHMQNFERKASNRINTSIPKKKNGQKEIKNLSPMNDLSLNDFHLDGNSLNGIFFLENIKKNDEISNNNFVSNFFSNIISNDSGPQDHNVLQPVSQNSFLEESKDKEQFLKSIRTYDQLSKAYLSSIEQLETRITQEDSDIVSESEADLMFSDTDCIDIFTNLSLNEYENNFFKTNDNVKIEEIEQSEKKQSCYFDFKKFDPIQRLVYQRKKIEIIIVKLNELSSPGRNQIFTCKICGKKFDNYFTLGGHVSRCMKMNLKSEFSKPTKTIRKQKNSKVSKFFL